MAIKMTNILVIREISFTSEISFVTSSTKAAFEVDKVHPSVYSEALCSLRKKKTLLGQFSH